MNDYRRPIPFQDGAFWELINLLARLIELPFRFLWIVLKIWVRLLLAVMSGGLLGGIG